MSKEKTVTNTKTSEVKVREANKAKNNAKLEERKKDGVTYLKEGVTGKMLNDAKIATNSNHKMRQANISQCIANAIEADKGYFDALNLSKRQLKSILRPAKLIEHATDWELTLYFNSIVNEKIGYPKFHVWGVLTMIKRVLDEKKVNPLAVQFFKAYAVLQNEASTPAQIEKASKLLAQTADKALANVEAKRAEKEQASE
jgi:hypothetical protein